jgi:integrase
MTRPVIEHYLSWLVAQGMAGHTTNTLLVCLRGFLETCRRYGWMSGLAATTAIYLDELPSRPRPLPRFVPEFVMAQIDDPANLARLPDDTTRHLLILIIETGLRANDACTLAFNPIIDDSVGWPCLRFFNHKMKAEQLVPLSARAAEAIRSQQTHLQGRWRGVPPPRLFPSPHCNPDGVRAFSYATFRERLARWEDAIGLHDEAGQPARVTAHQFRHTVGTRMINNDVSMDVVQRMLDHGSPEMTARYATIKDQTLRREWERFQQRINIAGELIPLDPAGSPISDAAWALENLARAKQTLPNGYCGLPLQQTCPHPNACLTCDSFLTTIEFLPAHRDQLARTEQLIAQADADGRQRLVEMNEPVRLNLIRIIEGLKTIEGDVGG